MINDKLTPSKPDVNDKLMKEAGFYRDLEWDNVLFNVCGDISYWVNSSGIKVVTVKKDKIFVNELIKRVADNVAYQTRRKMGDKVIGMISNELGFVNFR